MGVVYVIVCECAPPPHPAAFHAVVQSTELCFLYQSLLPLSDIAYVCRDRYLGDGRFHLESIMIANPDVPAYR